MSFQKGESRGADTPAAFGCNYSGNYEVSMPGNFEYVNHREGEQ